MGYFYKNRDGIFPGLEFGPLLFNWNWSIIGIIKIRRLDPKHLFFFFSSSEKMLPLCCSSGNELMIARRILILGYDIHNQRINPPFHITIVITGPIIHYWGLLYKILILKVVNPENDSNGQLINHSRKMENSIYTIVNWAAFYIMHTPIRRFPIPVLLKVHPTMVCVVQVKFQKWIIFKWIS